VKTPEELRCVYDGGKRMITYLKYNSKLILSYNVLASCVFAALSPILFRYRDMQFQDLAKLGELYLSLTGVFLFIPIGRLEEYRNTWELVYSKSTSFINLQLGRILMLLCVNAAILFVPLSVVYMKSPELRFGTGFWGIVISAWFLGLLGLLIVELTGNHKIGFLVTIGYYYFETSTKGSYNHGFQVFGYLQNNVESKKYVFLLCIVMIALQLLILRRRLKVK
jgi:hypothetical protein